MELIASLTPVFYRLVRIGVQRDGDDVVATADLQILNRDGRPLVAFSPSITLTAGEKQTLRTFVSRELTLFENVTGLEKWEES
jgi:hypothetical protein